MSEKKRNILTAVSLICSAVLIILGLMRQEEMIVLQKAVNVCLECIGIG